jgi:cation transport ATPase
MIYRTVRIVGGKHGSQRRDDHFKETTVAAKQEDDEKESAKMLDSTKSLGIISPLIASATFSATFAIPAGLKARDFTDGGAPGLFGTWPFNAFMAAITLAFISSLGSTISLVFSGMPSFKFPIRRNHFRVSFGMMTISLTCLAAAFGLGLYMVLTPLGHATAISPISMLVSLVPLFRRLEFIGNIGIVTSAVRARRGFRFTCMFVVCSILKETSIDFVPLIAIVIFGTLGVLASHQKDSGLVL